MTEKTLETMTKDERSLLLFFESAAVEHGGLCGGAHMNADDFEIAKRWNAEGFISFGRVRFHDIAAGRSPRNHWCELSDAAWKLAHEERRARCGRIMDDRNWRKAGEE